MENEDQIPPPLLAVCTPYRVEPGFLSPWGCRAYGDVLSRPRIFDVRLRRLLICLTPRG